jgi:hypothetical protein
MRFARIAFHIVSGRQVFRHPCTQDHSYILEKLIAFHQEHETPMKQVLVDLESAIEQIPSSAHASEASVLADALTNILLPGFTLSCYLRLVDWTSRLLRKGKARVSAEMSSIFERLRLDAGRWEATLLGLLKGTKLVGHFFGRIEELERVATRLNRRWIKNRGTRAAAIA